MKEITDNLDFIKSTNFCFTESNMERMERQAKPRHPSGRRITLNAPLHQQHPVWEDRESPGWYEGPYQTVSLTVTQG